MGEDAEKVEAKQPPGFTISDRRTLSVRDDGEAEVSGEVAEVKPRLPTYVEQLERKLSSQQKRLEEHLERMREENEAFRARQARDLERRAEEAKAKILGSFLEIADSLDQALLMAEGAEGGSSEQGLLDGIRIIRRQLSQKFRELGVEEIEAQGASFNPELHEAVGTVSIEDASQEGLILEEVQRGYLMGGTVLRPARVRVGVAARPSPAGGEAPSDRAQGKNPEG
ncbi:MAG: nucleotide exchange factor GrpE [Nitrospinota bacterium]